MAILIAIEGIDGSGKGTQSQMLQSALETMELRTQLLSFPRYEQTVFGKSIGDFLNGRFGSLDQVSPFLAALLYAGDRFESREVLLQALDSSDVVILDRYVASNIAHQGAKVSGAERMEMIEWIERIEWGVYQLPRPTLNILLDLPATQARKLIAKKNQRSYTDREADLQEADTSYLEQVRQVYLQLASEREGWRKIDCLEHGELRSLEAISQDLLAAVQSVL